MQMKYKDLLVIDPCYIKSVKLKGTDEQRFDGLKCVKTLHEGDDGVYKITTDKSNDTMLGFCGVDSGRIWVLKADFNIDVELDNGLSPYTFIESNGHDVDKTIELLRSF